MLPLTLGRPRGSGYEVLCIGAHSDDIEIGCLGSMTRLLREQPIARVTWVVLSGDPERAREAHRAARRVLGRRPGVRIIQKTFRDSFFPYTGGAIKSFFHDLRREVEPDLVFTHYREDLHQDHRLVSELTYNAFRDHLILEFEIMKPDGDVGRPNVYVPLPPAVVERKVTILETCFTSQRARSWFGASAFRALMQLRGVEARSTTGFAEAFHCRKLTL